MPENNVGDSLDGGEVEYHEELHEGLDDVELYEVGGVSSVAGTMLDEFKRGLHMYQLIK